MKITNMLKLDSQLISTDDGNVYRRTIGRDGACSYERLDRNNPPKPWTAITEAEAYEIEALIVLDAFGSDMPEC